MLKDNSHVVVTLNSPAMWQRDTDETWMLNPRIRYVVQAKHLPFIQPQIATASELRPDSKYRPLFMSDGVDLAGKKILVERGRDCGIGDLLFMSGPLGYIHHTTGGKAEIDFYGANEKSLVLDGNPALHHKVALRGPLTYDTFGYYDYQWLIPSATEFSEEPDQLNVYDSLYSSLGIDYKNVDPRWKRPSIHLNSATQDEFNAYRYILWTSKNVDLRNGYFLVAPHCYSSLRTADYRTWLNIIRSLAPHKPVVLIGGNGPSPEAGITLGQFLTEAGSIPNVLNLFGGTTLKTMLSLIQNANVVLTLDTAPLYIAQAFRTPAISLWGTHDPKVRLRYDPAYLRKALWTKTCPNSPCSLYRGFSAEKCPNGVNQGVCANLQSVDVQKVLDLSTAILNGDEE